MTRRGLDTAISQKIRIANIRNFGFRSESPDNRAKIIYNYDKCDWNLC